MNTDDIYKFIEQHCITKLDMQYNNDGLNAFGVTCRPATCNLEISIDELNKIIQYEITADKIISKLEQEKKLRELYPAVAKAYSEYQLLVALTQKESK